MNSTIRALATLALIALAGAAAAQDCANGVPSAGNPSCIPPAMEQSPYYNGGGYAPQYQQEPPRPMPTWHYTFGAVATDETNTVVEVAVGGGTQQASSSLALVLCMDKGGKRCEVSSEFNYCIAVATETQGNDHDLVFSNSETLEVAETKALGKCSSSYKQECQIVGAGCNEMKFF